MILIGGCSFSQSQIDESDNAPWLPWSDLIQEEKENCATSSYGQGMIVRSIIEKIELQKFNPNFVIVQWSAVQRGYTSNQTDVVEAIVKNREILFSHYDTEYWSDNVKVGYASNGFDDLTHETYVTAFTHITLLQNYLERKGIRYLFFWGWEQINVKNPLSYKFKELYKTTKIGEWWIPRNHIGFKEWAQEEIGTDADLENDFHPSTAAHKIFYEKIIKPKINKLL